MRHIFFFCQRLCSTSHNFLHHLRHLTPSNTSINGIFARSSTFSFCEVRQLSQSFPTMAIVSFLPGPYIYEMYQTPHLRGTYVMLCSHGNPIGILMTLTQICSGRRWISSFTWCLWHKISPIIPNIAAIIFWHECLWCCLAISRMVSRRLIITTPEETGGLD